MTDQLTRPQGGVTKLSDRRPGPDVVRALAMLGVIIMNYNGYTVVLGGRSEGSWVYSLFAPWDGPLSTRFAATFVLTAGVGVTLLTRSSVGDPAKTGNISWLLVRRGLLLYGGGMVFDMIWSGTILPYYGAMFVVAAVLWRLPKTALAAVAASSAALAWVVHGWVVDQEFAQHNVSWFIDPGAQSPRGLLINVLFNGTHPLFPWLAFFCAGIILGRLLDSPKALRVAFALGTTAWIVSWAVGLAAEANVPAPGTRPSRIMSVALSVSPWDRGIIYTLNALGFALIAFTAINGFANRSADSSTRERRGPRVGSLIVDNLRRAGQMSLTIYLSHALVFNLIVNWLGWVRPGTITQTLLFALGFWVIATSLAIAYQRRYGRGPAERIYRRLTGSSS